MALKASQMESFYEDQAISFFSYCGIRNSQMNIFRRMVVAFTLICAAAPLHAYVVSLQVWRVPRADGTFCEVLVIGERHVNAKGMIEFKQEGEHKPVVIAALEHMAQEKIYFSMEAGHANFDAHEKQYEHLMQGRTSLEHELRRFAHRHNFQYQNMKIHWADLRDEAVGAVVEFVHCLQSVSPQLIHQVYSIFKDKKLGNMAIDYTAHDFLRTLKQKINKLKDHWQACVPGSAQSSMLGVYLENLNAAYDNWKDFLVKNLSSLDAPCIDAIWKDRIAPADQKLFDEEKHFMPVNWHLADAGFIMDVEQNKDTFGKIVCFMGNSHAVELNEYFHKVGAQCVKRVGSQDKDAETPVSVQKLQNLLRYAFSNTEYCKVCFKAECQMKHCGACKTAKYCSIECQRADWPAHKLLCKKN